MTVQLEHPIWSEDEADDPPLSGTGCLLSILFGLGFWGVVFGIFWWIT